MSEPSERERGAALFAEEAVVRCYHARPPYPQALYEVLLAHVAGRRRALDLGCGPGKIARVVADRFETVVALDPSAAMLQAGRAAAGGVHRNIEWVEARGEDYGPAARFDLVLCGAAIHWMDARVIFPKLARWTDTLAVLNDAPVFPEPAPPCGMDAWIAHLNRWLPRTGRPPIDAAPLPQPAPHEAWMDVVGRRRFRSSFRQSIQDFVLGQHSRVSWARPRVGDNLADAYDRDLDGLMRPFADGDGILTLDVVSDVVWGRPLAEPRPGGSG